MASTGKAIFSTKQTMLMRKLYLCILVLLAVISNVNQVTAQSPGVSVGPAPFQPGTVKNDILPSVANPASRGFCYNGASPFQLNKQSLANTTLTPIGATVTFGFPGASAWVTTTNKLYVVDQAAPFALYSVDTITGVRTFIANCSGVPQTNFTGITWDYSTNTMYGVSSSLAVSQIFTVNITTGVCTPIGAPSGVCAGAIMVNAARGGSLFSVDIVNDNLYRWNKTTGVATLIGPLGLNANFGQDGHFDLSDGQYYWAAYNATANQGQLRTIDTLTGGSTLVGAYAGQVETLGIYSPLNPPNDDCVNAIPISCAGTASGSTVTATLDGPPTSCTGGSVAPDVWYTIVGTGSNITARLCGSAYDTKLDIYTGSCGALTSVVCNDDFCGLQSQVTWGSTLGVTYYIRVHGFAGATGAFTLNIICQPINDNCSGAININCGQSIAGTNVGATADAAPVCTGTTNPGVWYTFIGAGGTETVNTCTGTSFDTKISVYSGTCATLVCEGGNDDFCGLQSQVSFVSIAGTRYYVLVHGFGGATGNFTLTRICPPCSGVPSPGSISGPSSAICPATPVTLTLSGNTIANGITYQWKSSLTPGGPYTSIPGATSVTYSFNATTTTYFIVSVTCTNPGGGTGNTVEFPVRVSNLVHSNLLATPSVVCSPGSTTISGTVSGSAAAGNYTHTLTGPGVIGAPVVSGANNSNVSFAVTVIPAGVHTYILTSTDAIGCTVSSNIVLTVNQTPIITLTTTPPGTPPAPPGTNYVYSTSTGNAIVPGITLVPGSQGDDVTAAVALPFTYNAYGTNYNSLRVSSNGNIQFTGAGNTAFTNTCPIPTGTNLGFPSFMLLWDDLRTDLNPGDGVFTSVSGVAPNRIFNIEWRGTLFGIGGSTINMEARLFEGLQRVDFIYGTNTNNGASASIGVQGAITPTTLFTQYSCNSASLGSGLGISFVLPSPVTICNGTIVRIDASAVPGSLQTFDGPLNTHIPVGGSTSGNASPYPNTINVSGLVNSGVTVKSVTLNAFSHELPDDVDIVLVSPSGQSVILMSDAGGNVPATGQTFTFDDAAAATLFDAAFNPSGTYKPTNYGAGDIWPAPGPGGTPSSTTLSTFSGNANGNWSLYVVDDATGNIGFISSWSITLSVPQPVTFSPLTNLFTDAAATIPYTGTPVYTVWARPSANTTYTASSTIAGCSNSAVVIIAVNNPPVITTQPAPATQTICPGFNVVYTVAATGSGLTYQWRRNGVNLIDGGNISGSTTNTLTLTAVTTANSGTYDVVVSGTCPPAVTSVPVVLNVATAPTITTQPVNVTACQNGNAVFSVVATGVPPPTIYQWQVSTTGPGGPWINLTTGGSYTSTFTISGVTLTMNGNLYRVIVTNSCNQSVTSNAVTLTVNPTPANVVATDLFNRRICLSDTLIPLVGTPVGGTWSGIGVSGFNFIPSATGIGTFILTYTYTNSFGCTASDTTKVIVSDCGERIRLLSDDAIILFPNPNNGRFNIRINSTLYNYLGMKVFNSSGQLMNGTTVNKVLTSPVYNGLVYGRVIPIDLSYLPSGIYLVKFYYDDGIRTSEKTFKVVMVH